MTATSNRSTIPDLILALFLPLLPALATTETMDQQQARIKRLEDMVLAPCCYTAPLSSHQSEISVKMRIEIAKWVADGRSDQEILNAYVQQYGAKVLVDPRPRPRWWAQSVPWLALIVGFIFAILLLRRWRSTPPLPNLEGPPLPDSQDEDSPGLTG